MDHRRALALLGDLPAAQINEVWQVAKPMMGTELRPGIWLGRNGGMPWPMKRLVRHVVRRDYFAKLIVGRWGINIRVRQDGTHALISSGIVPVGVRVDLPFVLTEQGLDYGVHAMGLDVAPRVALQLRDYLRRIDFATLTEVVSLGQLHRVGAVRGEPSEPGELVLGYIAPAGVQMLAATPFGMVWHRRASRSEIASAQAYVQRVRLWDTSAGRVSAIPSG